MRKIAWLLVVVLVLGLTACGEKPVIGEKNYKGSSDENSKHYDELLDSYEKDYSFLVNREIPAEDIIITCKGNIFNAHITITGADNITNFGNHILYAIDAFKALLETEQQGKVHIDLLEDDEIYMSFEGDVKDSKLGTVKDYRSGSLVVKQIDNADDLAKMFPLASLYDFEREQYLLSIMVEALKEKVSE